MLGLFRRFDHGIVQTQRRCSLALERTVHQTRKIDGAQCRSTDVQGRRGGDQREPRLVAMRNPLQESIVGRPQCPEKLERMLATVERRLRTKL